GTAYPSPSTNSSGSAYGNNWAATPRKVGPFDAGRHLPITKAQEVILPSMSEPWIETFPMYEPKPWDLPIPNEITPPPTAVPMPLEGEEGKYGPVPTEEECDREWAEAGRACRKKRDALQAQAGRRKVKFDVDRCAAGLVSEACGGNPVDWGRPRRSIRPYKPLQA